MKVDIRHTGLRGLENKVARAVDGYQQFARPLKRIQSMKRGLSRLQNLFCYSQEMKVFDHSLCGFLLLLSVLSTHPLHSLKLQ